MFWRDPAAFFMSKNIHKTPVIKQHGVFFCLVFWVSFCMSDTTCLDINHTKYFSDVNLKASHWKAVTVPSLNTGKLRHRLLNSRCEITDLIPAAFLTFSSTFHFPISWDKQKITKKKDLDHLLLIKRNNKQASKQKPNKSPLRTGQAYYQKVQN